VTTVPREADTSVTRRFVLSPAALQAADAIDADAIRDVIAEIASDAYAGRGPGTDGDAWTQVYISRRLRDAGFAPGGPNGSWFQPFELVGVTAAQPPVWRFALAAERTPAANARAQRADDASAVSAEGPIPATVELEQGDDFIVASGMQSERAAVDDAELVFVGYGIEAPEHDWDDFKDVDVAGKVLVMLNNDPDWDPSLFAGTERLYYGRWTYKYESAARQGAAGAIIVHTTASAGYPWQVVQSSWSGTQFELPAGDEPRLAVAGWITETAAHELAALSGYDWDVLVADAMGRDFVPVELGLRTSIELRNALRTVETANVAGILAGRDPDLADELVIYTAHHDHLGVADGDAASDATDGGADARADAVAGAADAARAGEDRIYNGARDNATGVGMLLAIGAAFAALPEPPRRSVMLLFPAAEEQGLLGSEHFAAEPPVPPGKIAANINYDSGNIWGETHDITFIGLGKSSLDDVARAVARQQGRAVRGDQSPDRGSYYRSDQLNFAKLGVPAFYFASGTDFVGRPPGWGAEQINAYTDRDYHQPSDELTADWSFAGMVEDARFGFLAGWLVANDAALPQWNPGAEFEAVRRQALEDARAAP
jgi:Zn-dependent M28 family amino/carboxypeptidase